MKQEIIDWYSERHYQPHKMIQAGKRWGFNQTQVEAAMSHCYYKIVNEKKQILDVDVARYVRNVAKEIEVEIRTEELQILYESKDRLDMYKSAILGTCIISALVHGLLILYYITLV